MYKGSAYHVQRRCIRRGILRGGLLRREEASVSSAMPNSANKNQIVPK